MKIENVIEAVYAGNRLKIFAGGSDSALFCAGDVTMLKFGRVKAGGFTEAQGLPEKLRRHAANDRLSVETDSENVIPFGCEYRIRRHWKTAGSIIELTSDIAAENGGRISELELEELVFPIAGATVEYLVFGENSFRKNEAYSGSEMILMLRVTAPGGEKVEFYAGDDLWRHRAASGIAGAAAEYHLEISGSAVRYTRKVLSIPEDIIPEKRPWRFKSLIALSAPGKPIPAGEVWNTLGCFASAPVQRGFRTFVRKLAPETSAALAGDFPTICQDGSHQSRPGKNIVHGDLAEVFNAWVWAAGDLAKRGSLCAVRSDNRLFTGSVILEQMAKIPEIITFGDEQ